MPIRGFVMGFVAVPTGQRHQASRYVIVRSVSPPSLSTAISVPPIDSVERPTHVWYRFDRCRPPRLRLPLKRSSGEWIRASPIQASGRNRATGPISPEHGSVDRVPRLQCRPVSNKGLSGSTRDLRSRVAEQAARTGLSTSWERLGGHLSMVMIREKAGIFYYRPQQVCQRELRSSVLSPRPKYVIIRGGQAACRSGQPGGDTL